MPTIPLIHIRTSFTSNEVKLLLDGEIRVIVEVENSDIRPLYLCGKVLATAVSQYAKYGGKEIPISDKLLFLQVFRKTSDDEDWSKLARCRYLQSQMLSGWHKCTDGRLKYSFHFGTTEEFVSDPTHQEPLRQEIIAHLSPSAFLEAQDQSAR
jgi:hypothetical protein